MGAYKGARLHIYRNVFDFNRHAIGAGSDTYGYNAEENLILKGGGYHGTWSADELISLTFMEMAAGGARIRAVMQASNSTSIGIRFNT